MRYLYQRILIISEVPYAVRKQFGKLPPVLQDEEILYREVVARALLDAVGVTGCTEAKEHNDAVRAARVWLKFGESRDLFFDYAGLSVDEIVPKMLETPTRYRED